MPGIGQLAIQLHSKNETKLNNNFRTFPAINFKCIKFQKFKNRSVVFLEIC